MGSTGRALAGVVCWALVLAMGHAARAQSFDLIEINAGPNPDHPDVTYAFVAVSNGFAEAAGVSAGDVNADGFADLLFCGTEGRPNELYVNDGDGTFTEKAAALGIDEPSKRRGNSLLIDYDNDGDLDAVTFGYPGINMPQDLDLYTLFSNNGAPAYDFDDVTAGAGGFVMGGASETTTFGFPGGAAAADVDGDGFLDFVAVYWRNGASQATLSQDQFRLWTSVPNPAPDTGQPGYSPRLFVDRTLEAGLDTLGVHNWMPSFLDIDRDGDPDLHLDVELGPDLLLTNDGAGVFVPVDATAIGLNFNAPQLIAGGDWGNEMGAAAADFDHDGDLDLYLTNPGAGPGPHKEDAFYRNDSDLAEGGSGLAFHHIGVENGVTSNTFGAGWGVVFADLDNDADLDLLTARGFSVPAENTVFRNEYPATTANGNVKWTDISASVPDFSRVGQTKDTARGLIAVDIDNDGDLDVVSTRSREQTFASFVPVPAGVFENTLGDQPGGPGNWLQVDLVEAGGSRNTVGARVHVRAGGPGTAVQSGEIAAGSSFLCQEPLRQHFGLGPAAGADWIAVRWRDGEIAVATAAQQTLSGRVVVDRALAGGDATGDLDGDGDLDCDDLGLFSLGRAKPAVLDALVPAWPWRITADADGNGLLDGRDFASLRAREGSTWCDVGGGDAGASGTPILTGSGSLQASSPVSLALQGAAPGQSAWLVIGFGTAQAGFSGGVLVPSPDVVLGPLPVSAQGDLALGAPWPGGVPPGTQIQFQYWIADPAASFGLAASNGLSALSP